MKDLFLWADNISDQPRLLYKSKERFANIPGSILTSIIWIFGFAFFITFYVDITSRKNPEIILSQDYLSEARFNISGDSFFFAIGLMKANATLISNLRDKFDVYMVRTRTNGSNKISPVNNMRIELISCESSSRVFQLNKTVDVASLIFTPLHMYYCLPDTLPAEITNTWGDPYFIVYKLYVVLKHSTPEILEEIKTLYFHIISTDNYFDGRNQGSPIQQVTNGQLIISGVNSSKDINIFYSLVDFVTDTGYILEDKITEHSYRLNRFALDTNERTNENILFFIKLTMSRIKEIYSRRYTKLQSTLANIGGITNFLFIAAKMISRIFSFTLYEHVIEPVVNKKVNHFSFLRPEISALLTREPLRNTMVKTSNPLTSHVAGTTFNETEIQMNTMSTDHRQRRKRKDNIFKKLCWLSPGIRVIKEKYEKIVDIRSMVKFALEFNMMKNVILTPNQTLLFKILDPTCQRKKDKEKLSLPKIKNTLVSEKANLNNDKSMKILDALASQL